MSNELKHYGVLGMKWGVRKDKKNKSKPKKRLSISDSGMITISSNPPTREGKRNFAIRSLLTIATLSATTYMATHPTQVAKGEKAVKNMLKKSVSSIKPKATVDSGIFSKSKNRMLTIAEAMDLGFDLRDDF